MPSAGRRVVPFWGLVAIVVALDRVTKVWAESALADGRVIAVIGQAMQLRLVHNPGAAFGIHVGPWSRWVFLVIAVGAVWLLHRMSREAEPGDVLRRWSVGIVAGGAAGNLIDRIISAPGVVDFIDIGLPTMRWPTFNVADMAVSCGAVVLAFSLWREDARRTAAPPA